MAQTSPPTAKELVYVSWCPRCPSSPKVWGAIETNFLALKQNSAQPKRNASPSDQNHSPPGPINSPIGQNTFPSGQTNSPVRQTNSPAGQTSSERPRNEVDRSRFAWKDATTWAVDHGQVEIAHVVRHCRLALVLYSAAYGSDPWCRQQELSPLLEAFHDGLISVIWLPVDAGAVPRGLEEITRLIEEKKTLWSAGNRNQSAVKVAHAVIEAWSEADVFAQRLAEDRQRLPEGQRVPSPAVKASHLAIVIEPTGEKHANPQQKRYIYALYRRTAGASAYEPLHDDEAISGHTRGDYPYPWLVQPPQSSEDPVRLSCPILERYLRWAQHQPEPFVVEIFAPDELLDEGWSQLHVPAGEECQWLIHAHPFLLLAASRLLSCHVHKGGYLADKSERLSRGTGQWFEADGLTKSHRFKPVMTQHEQVALRWSGPMAADRHECLKGIVHSMVPLALWPRHPVEKALLSTSLVTLGLRDPATDCPCCPDLDQFARKRWETAEDLPIDCTIVVDHPARRPPSLLDGQQLSGSNISLYISA